MTDEKTMGDHGGDRGKGKSLGTMKGMRKKHQIFNGCSISKDSGGH